MAKKFDQLDIKELPISNPSKEIADNIPPKIKVWWKHYVASKSIPYFRIGFLDYILKGEPDYHEIIPETDKHYAWILGAQPDAQIIKKISKKYNRQVHIVSMLINRERVFKTESSDIFKYKNNSPPVAVISRRPWFDHTVLDITTGKNQVIGSENDKNVSSLKGFNKKIYESFEGKTKQVFYCHCMAGRSRSFTETAAFLFQYPEIFDLNKTAWNPILDKIKLDKGVEYLEDLKYRLSNNPSISDIAEYVELCRPHVKPLKNLDGDQSGLLGLLALAKTANGISNDRKQNKKRLYKDAQDIGLILRAPLGYTMRNLNDQTKQKENFVKASRVFQDQNIILPIAMISPSTNSKNIFDSIFQKLKPCEQARFAILLRHLEESNTANSDKINLGFLSNSSEKYAKAVIKNLRKIDFGDRVELLEAFDLKRAVDSPI